MKILQRNMVLFEILLQQSENTGPNSLAMGKKRPNMQVHNASYSKGHISVVQLIHRLFHYIRL